MNPLSHLQDALEKTRTHIEQLYQKNDKKISPSIERELKKLENAFNKLEEESKQGSYQINNDQAKHLLETTQYIQNNRALLEQAGIPFAAYSEALKECHNFFKNASLGTSSSTLKRVQKIGGIEPHENR